MTYPDPPPTYTPLLKTDETEGGTKMAYQKCVAWPKISIPRNCQFLAARKSPLTDPEGFGTIGTNTGPEIWVCYQNR